MSDKEQDKIIDDLVRVIDAYESGKVLVSCQGQALDGYSALAEFIHIAKNARKLQEKNYRINKHEHTSIPNHINT